jgi:probable HAF family extracellular repeat protein
MSNLVTAISRLILLSLALTATALAHELRGYRIVEISGLPPPERPGVSALSINNRGHVTGRNFIYRNGELEILDLPGDFASGSAINDRDQIAGESVEVPFGPTHVFLWDKGSVQFIGTPDGTFLGFNPLNDRGEVVGIHRFDEGEGRAFLFRQGSLIDLGMLPGGRTSAATAINNHGVIVGTSEIGPPLDRHPFLYVSGQMIDLQDLLGGLPGQPAVPIDINDHGDITGSRLNIDPDGSSQRRPFIFTRGRIIDVALRPDHELAGPEAINIHREIVGWISTRNGILVAFHYHRGQLSLISELLDDSEPVKQFVRFQDATDINDRGQILTRGIDVRDLSFRSYILTPRSLPHRLVSKMLLLSRRAHLSTGYLTHLHRVRAALAASKEAAAIAALESFIEQVRLAPSRRIPSWLANKLLRDAEDVAEILRSWQRPAP